MEVAKVTMRSGKFYYIRNHTSKVMKVVMEVTGWKSIELVRIDNQEFENLPNDKLLVNLKVYSLESTVGEQIRNWEG